MSTLDEAARALLDEHSSPGHLLEAVQLLQREFAQITGIHDAPAHAEDSQAAQLAAGVAISPVDAGRCIVDFARTATFVRGIRQALDELHVRFPGERIEILYAGCGPYATLAMPLLATDLPGPVAFTLLDIHPRALEGARKLVEHYGFSDRVADYVLADATGYVVAAPVHMVIAETMQHALQKEPQFALTKQLARQLKDGGIFLPEKISVRAVLADLESEFRAAPASEEPAPPDRQRIDLATLLELGQGSVESLAARISGASLPPVRCPVHDLPEGRVWHAMLCTEVQVWSGHILGDYDSGITYPVVLNEVGPLRGGEELEFCYTLGELPGFRCTLHRPPVLRDATSADTLAVLALNLESEHQLSPMNGQRLEQIASVAACFRVVEVDDQVAAFMIALPRGARYDSRNYQWFEEWFDPPDANFLYVDRIVVAGAHRGRGIASRLYDDLFALARAGGMGAVVCEINADPPNPASRAFHASYGFVEVGTREGEDGRRISLQAARLRGA